MLAAVVAVMIYRMVIAVVFNQMGDTIFQDNAKVLAAGTAAFLNLCIIVMFNFVSKIKHGRGKLIARIRDTG